MRWLVVAAIAVRLLAAAALAFGPWTDSANELAGWDVERFQQIADAEGRPWVDNPVEYPPGSVVIIEAISRDGVVGSHRTLVLGSILVDGAIAVLITVLGGRRAGATYLVLGLPLVPMGLLRLDLWSVALAVVAMVALVQRKPRTFAVLTASAALIKVWPALLLASAAALGRWRSAGWAALAMALAGSAWIGWAGWTLEPIAQVVSLRGATGWHLESVPGSVTALFSDAVPELQFNAYRIGTMQPWLVRLGQAVTATVVVGLTMAGWRATSRLGPDDRRRGEMAIGATVLVGAVSALIVTAPLLSPQFLLWLPPWAALATSSPSKDASWSPPLLTWLVGGATSLTGITLLLFGPPNLAATAPAALLLVRDGMLVAVVVAAARSLGGAEHPLRNRSTGPGPAGTNPEIDQMADETGGFAR